MFVLLSITRCQYEIERIVNLLTLYRFLMTCVYTYEKQLNNRRRMDNLY